MPTETLGFSHFIAQSDAVGKFLLVVLLVMSAVSWYLIVTKAIAHLKRKQRSAKFLHEFWNATSLEAVANEITTHGAHEPFAHLTSHAMYARAHHARHGVAKLAETGTPAEFLTRTMKTVLDEETARMESGLAALASIGATAPFVGLFGTVWGVYHALVAIGVSGAGTLDKVAGPVGEALIMTGVGLAVAIPAVLGYNYFTRVNRMLLARLDAFAYELFTFLSTGEQLGSAANVRPLAQGTHATTSQAALRRVVSPTPHPKTVA
ncbi:MAG: MotA/TolQ/ExbB proton channel family protein [Burkholderiaceae bacterium]